MQQRNSVTTFGLGFHRYDAPSPFGIKLKDRLSHVYAVGQTGAGKSTLLGNIAMQDAAQGNGFCLIDPHGDLAVKLHQCLNRYHFYWDVSDPDSPFGYNPIAPVAAQYRPLIASALIETLKKQWPEAWGARMEHLLRYAVLALLEEPECDMRDIVKLFVWKSFRKRVIDGLSDPMDVEATRSIPQAEVGSTRTTLDRVKARFELYPERLFADTVYGSGPMLGWLVNRKIAPHIPVIHCPAEQM